jgi:hypothetical protein
MDDGRECATRDKPILSLCVVIGYPNMPQDHSSFIIPVVRRTGERHLYKNQITNLVLGGGDFIFSLKLHHICGTINFTMHAMASSKAL